MSERLQTTADDGFYSYRIARRLNVPVFRLEKALVRPGETARS